jgi:hypothetical protein
MVLDSSPGKGKRFFSKGIDMNTGRGRQGIDMDTGTGRQGIDMDTGTGIAIGTRKEWAQAHTDMGKHMGTSRDTGIHNGTRTRAGMGTGTEIGA